MAEDALAVNRLSELIASGSLAQIYNELQSPLWSPAAHSPRVPPPPAHRRPSLLDRPDALDQLPLSATLHAAAWRQDALVVFQLLLDRGADPLATSAGGRRVDWDLSGRGEAFQEMYDAAVAARRAGKPYSMPSEVKSEVEELHRLFQAQAVEAEQLKEQVRRAKAAAAAVVAQQRAPSEGPSATVDRDQPRPSRLPPRAGALDDPSTALKRPSVSGLSAETVKRPRLSASELEELPDYDEESNTRLSISPEDVKPVLPRFTPANSPLPPPTHPPPGAVLLSFKRLPPYITPAILLRWLEYGTEVFTSANSPSALALMSRGYYKRMPKDPPPRPLSVELVESASREGGEPEEAAAGKVREAVVGYRSQDHAWEAKQTFDAQRVLPKCTDEQLVEVTLL